MPKQIGNGKSTMQGLVMDGTIILTAASGKLVELTIAADKSIAADLKDDPYMAATLQCIKDARAETNPDARDAALALAEQHITKAIELDNSDESIVEFRNLVLPTIQQIDAKNQEMLELQNKLSKAN